MSIRIQTDLCKGCGACTEVCPGNLLRLGRDGKAGILRPEECWGCTSCLKECRFGAIRFFLGADMGGQGGEMYVKKEGPLSHWIIQPPQGDPVTITVDGRNSNRY
jgi:adenylylsulfate reductase subunit B